MKKGAHRAPFDVCNPMALSGHANLAAALSGDGDNGRADRHGVLEVRPSGCWCFIGGQTFITWMLDCEEHRFALGIEQRASHLCTNRNPEEQL